MPEIDPHDATVEIYEDQAAEWLSRAAVRATEVRQFSDRLQEDPQLPHGAVVDLGCGPGTHLAELPPGTIAMDASAAMLDLARDAVPGCPSAQADLRALPIARHSMRAVWANKSYVHLARTLVPMALWDLHRVLAPGGVAGLGLFGGDQEHGRHDGDYFPGRHFSLWPDDLLTDVIEGAGFHLESLSRPAPEQGDAPYLFTKLRRQRSLADTVGPDMRLLLVGLNPSLHAADSGVGFSGPSNRGWPALLASGLAAKDRDPVALLRGNRIGMTDLGKRATARASELERWEYQRGIERLDRLCAWLKPAAVCVVGLSGWRAAVDRKASAGLQQVQLGG
ncbi:MAG: methyltransferase domain-containing protein, partial [Microthrixaceae bacterium]